VKLLTDRQTDRQTLGKNITTLAEIINSCNAQRTVTSSMTMYRRSGVSKSSISCAMFPCRRRRSIETSFSICCSLPRQLALSMIFSANLNLRALRHNNNRCRIQCENQTKTWRNPQSEPAQTTPKPSTGGAHWCKGRHHGMMW